MLQKAENTRLNRMLQGAEMLNRRQVLNSLFSIAAGSACAQAARACNTVAVMHSPTSDSSVTRLAELLRETIEICRNSPLHRAVLTRTLRDQYVRTRQLCEIALARLHQSPNQSPAFWQACVDSVERLEATIPTSSRTVSDTPSDVARTLRRLRRSLTDQTVVAMEARTLQA